MSEENSTNNLTGSQENQNQNNGRTSGTSTQVRDPNEGAEFHSDFATAVLRDIVNGNTTTNDNNGEGAIDADCTLLTLDPGLSVPSTVPMNLSTSSRGESSSCSGNLHATPPPNTAGSYGPQQPLTFQLPTIHPTNLRTLCSLPTLLPSTTFCYSTASRLTTTYFFSTAYSISHASIVHPRCFIMSRTIRQPTTDRTVPLPSISISGFLWLLCEWTTPF